MQITSNLSNLFPSTWFQISAFVVSYPGQRRVPPLFIYKAESLFVCLYLIEIHTSKPIWTKLCTHLLLGLEETAGYVFSENVCSFLPFWPSSSGRGAESSARNGYRRETSATVLYPWFLLVLVWCHGNDVVADDSFAFLLEVLHTMDNAQ
jgi:hypothetical protein